MASNKFLVLAIFAIVFPFVALATDYIVGDDIGWTINYNYTKWTEGKVFRVGDTLVFNYQPPNHNVFKVNGTGFKDCIKPSPNEALTSGNDRITLQTPGKKWYICGVKTHCSEFNQKLVINVDDEAPTSAPAPAPSSPENSAAHGIISSGYQVLMAAAIAAVAMVMV